MKALVLEKPGDAPSLSIRDMPMPSLGPNDVLVKVAACGLCYHDVAVMQGVLRRGVKKDVVLGHEISGTVAEVGQDVDILNIGDSVVSTLTTFCGDCDQCLGGNQYRCIEGKGFGHALDGGLAEYITLPQSSIVTIPKEINVVEASILACPIGVGIRALEDMARLTPGETVLITGAGGGLGVHAFQLASALGARAIAITSSPEKLASLEELNCGEVFLADDLDFSEIVLVLTEDEGADVVINTVGSAVFKSCLSSMASRGRMVVLGEIAGGQVSFNLAELMFRDATIIGSTGASPRHIAKASEMVSEGKIKPIVSQTFKFEDVLDAYDLMREGKTFGRVALVPPKS